MNQHAPTSIALATLAARSDNQIGLVALALDLTAAHDGWQQLLPAGHFTAIDGRPFDVAGGQWFIDAATAERLIARTAAAANDLVIDYEHQTLYSEQNGQPAPAAGWFKSEMEWREGSGLWIKPRWTPRALDFIKNGEYRYLSAVFPYDKQTGQPLALHSAALVNRPGIDGMQAVEALRGQMNLKPTETPAMNETLRKLLAQLGIELSDGDTLTDDQGAAALSALTALKAQATQTNTLEGEVAALKAQAGSVDLSKYVPAVTYNALVTAHAALKAGTETESAERLIADARKEGKVLAAEQDYLTQFAEQQGVAALKGLIDARPAVAALKGTQTEEKAPPASPQGGLTQEELAVCKATGISPEQFKKTKGA